MIKSNNPHLAGGELENMIAIGRLPFPSLSNSSVQAPEPDGECREDQKRWRRADGLCASNG